jgi:magnesium-protoporphyrin O-methyltransferase
MQRTLLDWLPTNLSGMRVLDAGCGTGMASIELARRGAEVVAIDLSPTLVAVARDRAAQSSLRGRVDFRSGDMLNPALGTFDHVIAMDSLIHYEMPDALAVLTRLAPRVRASIVWTFAPRTPLLAVMHSVGRLLPGRDRAPRIVPMREAGVRRGLQAALGDTGWTVGRTVRVQRGFYTSQGLHLSLTPRRTP